MADNKQKQIEIAERLQMKILQRFEKLIDSNELQATDAATLVRLLMNSGWSIDPARVPKGLQGVLTQAIDAAAIEEDERH